MKQYFFLYFLFTFFTINLSLCKESSKSETIKSCNNSLIYFSIDDSIYHDGFCDYFYSKDTINDTLHFDFEGREDFGPIYLSDDEMKQIYCEIKRGNISAFKTLCHDYFYSDSYYIPNSDLDKLICISDFLAQKYYYYGAYLTCGNILFDNIKYNAEDYYVTKMITYYEKYFELFKLKDIAIKLFEIYNGNYSFHDKDPIKAEYYGGFCK